MTDQKLLQLAQQYKQASKDYEAKRDIFIKAETQWATLKRELFDHFHLLRGKNLVNFPAAIPVEGGVLLITEDEYSNIDIELVPFTTSTPIVEQSTETEEKEVD